MTAISTRQPEVTIEYDTAKGRVTRHFEDAHAAKAFSWPSGRGAVS